MAAVKAPSSDRLFSSNPQHGVASNFAVSTRRRTIGFALLSGLLITTTCLSAAQLKPIGQAPQAQRAPAKPSPARAIAADASTQTFERYGPQATARAVRASLKVALVPDPLCMASLLFCAFALRWMRKRKEDMQQPAPAIATNSAFPGAA